MLLLRIRRHLLRTGMSRTRFGREVIGDPNLLPQLEAGRQLRPGTARRITAYLELQGERK